MMVKVGDVEGFEGVLGLKVGVIRDSRLYIYSSGRTTTILYDGKYAPHNLNLQELR